MRTCSKKTKADSHIKDCKEQPREILPVKEQIHRLEPKKIYELEMKTCPKKTEKYSNNKDCEEQPREICDKGEMKSIQPTCHKLRQAHVSGDGCYNISRKTQGKICKTDMHRSHGKPSNSFPLLAKEQIHHVELKKINKLEMKTGLKKPKKDGYIKDCKEQPRETGDHTQESLVRTYEPTENEGRTDSGSWNQLEPMLDQMKAIARRFPIASSSQLRSRPTVSSQRRLTSSG